MGKDNFANYLKSHSIFSDLDAKYIKILAQHVEEASFASGDLLFKQQDAAANFFIVLQGSITVEVPSLGGPPLEVQTLGVDEVLGWSWLIPPYRWAFEAKADSDLKVLKFDGKRLLQLCEKDNEFGYALMKKFTCLMSERLHAARLKMMETWAPAGWA